MEDCLLPLKVTVAAGSSLPCHTEDTCKTLGSYQPEMFKDRRQRDSHWCWLSLGSLLPRASTPTFTLPEYSCVSLLMNSILVNLPTHRYLFVTSKSILGAFLQSFPDVCREVKNLSHSLCTFPAEVKQDDALPSCLNSHTVSEWSFWLSATVFMLLYCSVGDCAV